MHCDFVVHHDAEKETDEQLAEKIFYSIFIGRLKDNKPVNIMLSGGSGEGKSISGGIKLQELLMRLQGVDDIRPYFDVMNVYTPLEYPRKMNEMLFNKDLKKINIFTVHESRELVSSKTWQSFLTQAVASINATSRQVKRVMTIFISQSMSDVAKEVRKTLDFQLVMRRPRGKKPRMYIKRLWLDEHDPEKPQLRTRKIRGLVVDKFGRYTDFCPQYIEITKPSKDLVDMFDKADFEAKSGIIKKKFDKLMGMMEKEMGVADNKVTALVDFYTKDTSSLMLIGKNTPKGWKINGGVQKIHGLSDDDFSIFQKKINDKITQVQQIDEKKLIEELS